MDIVLEDFGMIIVFRVYVFGRVWIVGIRVYWNLPHLICSFLEFIRA